MCLSERRACRIVAIDRKTARYSSKRPADAELRAELRDLANARRRFGYRRLPAPLHRDLIAYAEVLARDTGQPAADPMKLIVPMLERFIATDRGFAKARRSAG
ncbi:hypothetical+protein [Methylocapsa aurea]